MYPNRQIFWNHIPALATHLGGVERIYGDYLNTGTFSLVFKHLPKQSKPGVMRRERKMSVLIHKTKRKVFNCNQIVFGHKPAADLVQIIRPLIGNLFVQPSDLMISFPLAVAPLDLAGDMSLQDAQPSQTVPHPTWIFDQFTARKGGKGFQADINANLFASWNVTFGGIRHFQHQANIPTVINTLDDCMLDLASLRQSAMKAYFHLTHVLQVKASAAMRVLQEFAAVTVGIFHALKAVTTLETRKSWLFSCLHPPKESGKCFVKAAQKLLDTAGVQLTESIGFRMTQITKIGTLVLIRDSLTCFLINGDALFKSGIVDKTGLPEQKVQLFHLLGIWVKEVLIGTEHSLTRFLHLNVTTDKLGGVFYGKYGCMICGGHPFRLFINLNVTFKITNQICWDLFINSRNKNAEKSPIPFVGITKALFEINPMNYFKY
jgi:hypothetical protein